MITYLVTKLIKYLIENAFYDEAEQLKQVADKNKIVSKKDLEIETENSGIKIPNDFLLDKEKYREWVPSSEIEIRNFRQIEGTSNYRSAQPPLEESFFRYLKDEYGIENILNLRDEISKNGKTEGQVVRDAGLNYENIHLTSKPPSDSQWSRISQLLDGGKTLIHCQHGADRTGAIVAKYRIQNQSVDKYDAYKEAEMYGFKKQTHPGYGKGSDPNKQLREWILN